MQSPYPRPGISNEPRPLHGLAVIAIWLISMVASLAMLIGWGWGCFMLLSMKHLHGTMLVVGMIASFACLPIAWSIFMVKYLKPRTQNEDVWAAILG